jgi:hypothetical protein
MSEPSTPPPAPLRIGESLDTQRGEGFLEFSWGAMRGHMSIPKALEHAAAVMNAAITARYDALLLIWLRDERILQDPAHATVLVAQFREWRHVAMANQYAMAEEPEGLSADQAAQVKQGIDNLFDWDAYAAAQSNIRRSLAPETPGTAPSGSPDQREGAASPPQEPTVRSGLLRPGKGGERG